MKYKIMGEYKGKQEEIDSAESRIMAEELKAEYEMAFGERWAIWVA